MAHTPGPWTVDDSFPDLVIRASDGVAIAHIAPTGGNEIENAHLIAAAPDLRAALNDLLNAVEAHGPREQVVKLLDAARLNARAAIAKAEGK